MSELSSIELKQRDPLQEDAHIDITDGEQGEPLVNKTTAQRDRDDLARVGKKEILKRNFTFLPILGFASTVIITWEAALITMSIGLPNGGQAGLIYGFIFIWIGMLAVFTTIGEIASIAPTSGGQYYWVFMLAPKSCRKFLSYMTGWTTLIGWQAVSVSTVYICATLVQGLIILTQPDANKPYWQGTLLLWAFILFCILFNTTLANMLPHVEGIGLAIHIVGFFAILVPLIYLAPHADPVEVFTSFRNDGMWPTQGVAFLVSINAAVFDFLGSDSVIHMAEEIRGAALIVPQTMVLSLVINGVLGLAALIAVFFCVGNSNNALEASLASSTGYPFIEIFHSGVGSVAGATIMTTVILIMQTFAAIGLVATTSRIYWSFARDKGLPFSQTLSAVSNRQIPVNAVAFTVLATCIIGLLNLAGATVFNDVVSLTVSALFTSYLLVCLLLLWRRCTGFISEARDMPNRERLCMVPEEGEKPIALAWGPWRVKGIPGIIVNAFACCFMTIIILFSFFPATINPTPATMNMNVLMLGASSLFAVIWYFFGGANKVYKGPVIDIDLE